MVVAQYRYYNGYFQTSWPGPSRPTHHMNVHYCGRPEQSYILFLFFLAVKAQDLEHRGREKYTTCFPLWKDLVIPAYNKNQAAVFCLCMKVFLGWCGGIGRE